MNTIELAFQSIYLSLVFTALAFILGYLVAGIVWQKEKIRKIFADAKIDWTKVYALALIAVAMIAVVEAYQVVKLRTVESNNSSIQIQTSGIFGDPPPVGKIYLDITGTQPVTEVQWGNLSAGGNKSLSFFLRNEGTNAFYATNLTSINMTPAEASQYIFFSWNMNETKPIEPQRIRSFVLTVSVSSSIFNITRFNNTLKMWFVGA